MPSRILDLTARDPEQVYICAAHWQFDARLNHTVPVDPYKLCRFCVLWEDLCPAWYEMPTASVRCLRPADHAGQAHLVDSPTGQRFSWMPVDPDDEDYI